jgi:endo-1,3-1,4-beta-glycanase ExoK
MREDIESETNLFSTLSVPGGCSEFDRTPPIMKNLNRVGLLTLPVLAAGVCASHIAAQVPSGFGATPIFDEEFNGSSLDAKVWTYRGAGTVKHDCYIDSNAVSVADGHARIRIYTANNSQGVRTNYCGAITTQSGTFLHTYGYWEASVRYQYQPGMHCGFWLDSPFIRSPIVNNPQQSGTEMDVFEHIESASPTEYDHAVWWNGYGAYATGTSHEGKQSSLDDGNFHTFGLAWTPGSLTFYVDGVQTWHLSASDAAISNIPEYIILDTELTSASGVPSRGYGPLGSPSNPYMDVDYVRVYPYSTKTTSTTLSPIANVYVQDGVSATRNFSGSPTLLVENGAIGDKHNSYLKFDLSNITAPVLQATLYLTPVTVGESRTVAVANYVPDSKTVNVANYVPDNRWTARGITWNNQPAISARLSTGVNYGQGILTSFDVTAVAKAGKQFSVQIAGDNPSKSTASIAYGSQDNEAISYRPQLVVISGDSSSRQQPTADDHDGPHATHEP